MKGTIIKRGASYSVVLDLGRGPDGKRIRKWHSGYRTKKEAEQAQVELLGKLGRGAYVAPSKLILAAFLREHWLPGLRAQVRLGTWAEHKSKVEVHLIPGHWRGAAPATHSRPPERSLCRSAGAGSVGPDCSPCPCHDPPGARRRGPVGHGPPQRRPAGLAAPPRPTRVTGVDSGQATGVPRRRRG